MHYLGRGLADFLPFPESTLVLCSVSEIFRAVLFKKELNLPSIIIQLCIVKESLHNYQLFHIDSGPTCSLTRHFILWFH